MKKSAITSALIVGGLVAAGPATAFADELQRGPFLQQEDEGDDDGDDEGDENSTPAPSGVDTGGALPGDDDTTLLVTAGALTALAGGAFALRRRELGA